MDSGYEPSIWPRGSRIPFTLERTRYTEFGSDGVCRSKMKPKILNLFPLKPAFEPLKRKNEQESPTVVGIRAKSVLESRELDCSAVFLSSFLVLGSAQDQADLQTTLKKLRQELLLVSSEAPCRGLIDSAQCHQALSTLSMVPYDLSAAAKGKCVDRFGEFVDLTSGSTYGFNGASTSAVGKSNGSGFGSALPSGASAKTSSPMTRSSAPSENTTSRQQSANAAGTIRRPSARHGPRPRSSSFRGVTHYKRTKRWEAHIWNKGKQIYLGASSTAEKAARAYDRAAIHFRKLGAELNYYLEDYAGELRRLVELSAAELVTMLRKQSAGEGSPYPDYPPPILELQLSPKEIVATKYRTLRENVDRVETIFHKSLLGTNYIEDDVSCRNFVGNMGQSDQPRDEYVTLHVSQAAHVSKRRGQYIQVIDDMTAVSQNRQEWLN